MAELRCPLCGHSGSVLFDRDSRDYFRCPGCRLVFVPPTQFLSRQAEKAIYDLHENQPDDPGYRRFLARLFTPLAERLPPRSRGLDFGSGPAPTLSLLFEEVGHSMQIYDPFYAPGSFPLEDQYDFVTASEVVEHFHHPQRDLEVLWSCTRPGGWLGMMTKRVRDRTSFSTWHYKRDLTHVAFFSSSTFEWLSERWNAELVVPADDVVLLRKPEAAKSSSKGIRSWSLLALLFFLFLSISCHSKIWTVTELQEWYASVLESPCSPSQLFYRGSDTQYHHFTCRPIDSWVIIQVRRSELILAETLPFQAPSQNGSIGYYPVDPSNQFRRIPPKSRDAEKP